jgi:hypothetical protein
MSHELGVHQSYIYLHLYKLNKWLFEEPTQQFVFIVDLIILLLVYFQYSTVPKIFVLRYYIRVLPVFLSAKNFWIMEVFWRNLESKLYNPSWKRTSMLRGKISALLLRDVCHDCGYALSLKGYSRTVVPTLA